jgi:hypothetical protein
VPTAIIISSIENHILRAESLNVVVDDDQQQQSWADTYMMIIFKKIPHSVSPQVDLQVSPQPVLASHEAFYALSPLRVIPENDFRCYYNRRRQSILNSSNSSSSSSSSNAVWMASLLLFLKLRWHPVHSPHQEVRGVKLTIMSWLLCIKRNKDILNELFWRPTEKDLKMFVVDHQHKVIWLNFLKRF